MSSKSIFGHVGAFVAGVLFALGLAISGMIQPSKVFGFLDVFGHWDASLAFVMGGAILAFAPAYHRFKSRTAPICGETFSKPDNTRVDGKLLVGSLLFGVGWGLGGLCPGPALTNLPSASFDIVIFVLSMVGGQVAHRVLFKKS